MRTEAQKRADKKYFETHTSNFTTIGMGVEKNKAEEIRAEAKRQGLTASKYLLSAVIYCMENKIEFNNKE